ncbi:MAG: DMT family transporter [Bacillus cereus]|jgi:drug/metabolite transporter (DMT)-like permease|uniref:DMT family transporter n=1 Tax=Bacillus cereus TaxID=1396 RepID=UPI000BFE574A|nr:DMT family transporter [Bacillus cereus]MDR2996061.1 DMT family transporter [Bacillus cereus]PGU09311.1 EamA family transporter [Bacillus cereus]
MNKKALTQLALAMSIFGSVGFFSHLTGLFAIELVFVRLVCAAIFLFTVWLIKGKFKTEIWNQKELLFIILCSTTNLLNWIFLFKSFEQTSVTIAISFYHLAPIFVLIIGRFIFREKLTWHSILAISLCFTGTLFIMGLGEIRSSSLEWNGSIYSVVAALFYAATMLFGKSVTKTSVYATTFLQMTIGILLLAPFVDFAAYTSINAIEWFYSILTGIVHTGIVYLFFFNSLRNLPTKVISFMIFIDPAVAILLDILLTEFRPDWLQCLGILLIFGGLLFTIKQSKPLATSESEVSGKDVAV